MEAHQRHCVVSLSRHFINCLVLAQPRKTGKCGDMTEKVLTGTKYQHKQNHFFVLLVMLVKLCAIPIILIKEIKYIGLEKQKFSA